MTDIHPTGQFPAGVTGNHFAYTSQKNTPYISVGFETEHGRLSRWCYLSDKAIKNTKKSLEAAGWDGVNIQDLADNQTLLSGNTCWITVEHEMYNDELRARVAFINKEEYEGGESNPSAMPGDLAKRLNILGGESNITPTPVATPKTSPNPDVGAAYDGDDEIPF